MTFSILHMLSITKTYYNLAQLVSVFSNEIKLSHFFFFFCVHNEIVKHTNKPATNVPVRQSRYQRAAEWDQVDN